MKHTVLITGAAGYVGTMLVQRFARREDVKTIIGLDKEPVPELIKDESKLVYLQMNTADEWEDLVRAYEPDIIIHAAWQIREIYGNRPLSWKWNIDGSEKVFRFATEHAFVKRLIHFSTVASYGAFKDNTLDHYFTEEEPFRKSVYLYAEEKRIAEEKLEEVYKNRSRDLSVSIVRPAAITGPRGRFMRIRFGLQATLAGHMKKESWVHRIVTAMVSFVPVTPKWVRQFIHEDDVVGIIERLSFGEEVKGYEIFNICPPGDPVYGKDMAKAVGKKTLPVFPWMVQLPFFVFWHLTRGKIPTGPGAWRSYSYPILVDGKKVTTLLNYPYAYSGWDAFYYTNGEYESYVPEELRRTK